jgi:hypothetical protein
VKCIILVYTYVPVAGAKADTDPVVASAIAAKRLIMDEKRNMMTIN